MASLAPAREGLKGEGRTTVCRAVRSQRTQGIDQGLGPSIASLATGIRPADHVDPLRSHRDGLVNGAFPGLDGVAAHCVVEAAEVEVRRAEPWVRRVDDAELTGTQHIHHTLPQAIVWHAAHLDG